MKEDLQSAVSAATFRVLKSLARVLLEARIGIGEFNALARRAYVRAAVEDPTGSGAYRVNVSRIAATTGLTRKEVAALLAEEHGAAPRGHRGRVRAERVLLGWWDDPEFQDRAGTPRCLKRKGQGLTFVTLVKRYSGDSHNAAPVLDELLRSQAIREREDGTLEPLRRTCANIGWDSEGIAAFGEELAEHVETLLHNLRHPESPRFARRIVCQYLDAYAARVLLPEIAEQAEVFLEGAQDALNHPRYPASSRHSAAAGLKVAVALQVFQEPASQAAASAAKALPPDRRRRRSLPRAKRSLRKAEAI